MKQGINKRRRKPGTSSRRKVAIEPEDGRLHRGSLLEPSRNVEVSGQFIRAGHSASTTINFNQPAMKDSLDDDEIESPGHRRQSQLALGMGNEGEALSGPPPLPVQRSSDIYYRHLAVKGRGSPMWLTEPSRTLPDAYLCRGVTVGDVGILTAFGGFDFMFNICLPADHPINQQGLPEGFSPLFPQLQSTDVQGHMAFPSDHYLATESVEKSQRANSSSEIVFESFTSEGAILTMPLGAHAEDIVNVWGFRQYLAANVVSWYRYVNDIRGREARNGDVRLVVGCDKASSWGMATFANSSAQDFQLKFKPTGEDSSRQTYIWEHSGMVETKAGPDPAEIEDLKSRGDSGASALYKNQCLFLRTMNATVRDDVWQGLGFDLESTMEAQIDTYPNWSPQTNFNSALAAHPSKAMNEYILTTNPHARIAITQDSDWISLIVDSDQRLPPGQELIRRMLTTHDICEAGDVVFLRVKQENDPTNTSSQQSGDYRVSQDYGANMPASPPQSSQASPAPPAEGSFRDVSMPPGPSSNQEHSWSNGYGRTSGRDDQGSGQGDLLSVPQPPAEDLRSRKLCPKTTMYDTMLAGLSLVMPEHWFSRPCVSAMLTKFSDDACMQFGYSPRSTIYSETKPKDANTKSSVYGMPRLCAPVIRLNDYGPGGSPRLRGAMADAAKYMNLSVTNCQVLRDKIRFLINKGISGWDIISAFDGLSTDPRIRPWDSILWYFAGHGPQITSSEGRECGEPGSKIQIFAPQEDYSKPGPGILDHTIGFLLDKITQSKDDNFVSVLLSEMARENNGRGAFTTELLGVLRTVPLDKLRYCDILDKINPDAHQKPQCDGLHHYRYLFNSRDYSPAPISQHDPNFNTVIDANVTDGPEFVFCIAQEPNSRGQLLGTDIMDKVTPSHPVIKPADGLSITISPLPSGLVAFQTKPGAGNALRLYAPEPSDCLTSPGHRDKMLRACGQNPHCLQFVDSREAPLELAVHENQVANTAGDTTEGLYQLPTTVVTLNKLGSFLSVVRSFYRELNHCGTDTLAIKDIDMEFNKLQETPSFFGDLSELELGSLDVNLFLDRVHIIVDDGYPHSIKLINYGTYDLAYYQPSASQALMER